MCSQRKQNLTLILLLNATPAPAILCMLAPVTGAKASANITKQNVSNIFTSTRAYLLYLSSERLPPQQCMPFVVVGRLWEPCPRSNSLSCWMSFQQWSCLTYNSTKLQRKKKLKTRCRWSHRLRERIVEIKMTKKTICFDPDQFRSSTKECK